jgi:16S rRNA (uracil1498-N3)-methyltransferase
MNLIILFDQDFQSPNTVRLSDDRFLHIKNIHQSSAGDTVRVGKLNGLMGTAVIQSISDSGVELFIELSQSPPPKLPLTLVLALPRPKMIRRIFRSICELGIEHLIIINSYKVEKSFWQSPALDDEKIKNYLVTGLQQAKDTMLPSVSFKRLFKPFVEDELPAIIASQRALIAHPSASNPCPNNIDSPCVLAIGPEGGFTDYEVGKFIEAGFENIHLGNRIFRVENAITALTSKLYQF